MVDGERESWTALDLRPELRTDAHRFHLRHGWFASQAAASSPRVKREKREPASTDSFFALSSKRFHVDDGLVRLGMATKEEDAGAAAHKLRQELLSTDPQVVRMAVVRVANWVRPEENWATIHPLMIESGVCEALAVVISNQEYEADTTEPAVLALSPLSASLKGAFPVDVVLPALVRRMQTPSSFTTTAQGYTFCVFCNLSMVEDDMLARKLEAGLLECMESVGLVLAKGSDIGKRAVAGALCNIGGMATSPAFHVALEARGVLAALRTLAVDATSEESVRQAATMALESCGKPRSLLSQWQIAGVVGSVAISVILFYLLKRSTVEETEAEADPLSLS